jgi:hypothetical protein
MEDLLLPVYLFILYLAILCWLRTPVKNKRPKPKSETNQNIKGILLPPQIREPIRLDLEEPETLNLKPQRRSRSKRTIKDLIQTAAAA